MIKAISSLKDVLENICLEKGFTTKDGKKVNQAKAYRACGLQKKTFENVFDSEPDHEPSKKVILQIVIGWKLSLEEALDVLNMAGFTLSPIKPYDKIIRRQLESGKCDLFSVNEELEYNGYPIFENFSLGFEKVA